MGSKFVTLLFRVIFSLFVLALLFIARDDAAFADLYIEVSFWINVVLTVILTGSLLLLGIVVVTEDK